MNSKTRYPPIRTLRLSSLLMQTRLVYSASLKCSWIWRLPKHLREISSSVYLAPKLCLKSKVMHLLSNSVILITKSSSYTYLISDNYPTLSVIRWSPNDCATFSSNFPRIKHRKERHLTLMVSVIPSDLKHPSFANTNVVFHMPPNLLKPSNLDNQGLNSLPSRLAYTKQSVLVNLPMITRCY